jgi:ABC-type antimicrobial peptide transport system permease subunit
MALSILISCLGLLGLVMYTLQTRTKEIGMRKILGASVSNIISLLSIEFVQLVIIAFVIAAPIAWFATDQWLQTFAYRTAMSWWVFTVSAMITISSLTIKTASENPVKSLRAE